MDLWSLNTFALSVFYFSLYGIQAGFGQNKSSSSQVDGHTGFVATTHQKQDIHKQHHSGEGNLQLDNDAMRALADITKHDDVTYSYYYDTIDLDPSYYDILDYVYVEGNDTSSVIDLPTAPSKVERTSTEGTTFVSSQIERSDKESSSNDSNPACDPVTHFGCDIPNFERCNVITRTCECLRGYMRGRNVTGKSPCEAADFFRGHLKIRLPDETGKSLSIQMIRSIETNLTAYLQLLLEHQDIGGLLNLNVYMPNVTPLYKHGIMSLTFDVALRRNSDHQHEIRDIWRRDLGTNPQSPNALSDLLHVIGWNNSHKDAVDLFSPLVETNPCHNADHNYCHAHSRCQISEGILTCTCQSGFQDVSPDITQAPGEVCVEDCRCENSGVCVKDPLDAGKRQCSCLNWYFGSKCQINGKELLIICCCSLGCLIVVVAILLCCYYGCVKQKLRATKTNLFSYTPNSNFLKLPRVWMESRTTPEHEISPCSIRRMSIGSDCNPYFDGLILEDLPPSTIQSQRRGDLYGQHYQTQNPGVATVSSHSFFCPY